MPRVPTRSVTSESGATATLPEQGYPSRSCRASTPHRPEWQRSRCLLRCIFFHFCKVYLDSRNCSAPGFLPDRRLISDARQFADSTRTRETSCPQARSEQSFSLKEKRLASAHGVWANFSVARGQVRRIGCFWTIRLRSRKQYSNPELSASDDRGFRKKRLFR